MKEYNEKLEKVNSKDEEFFEAFNGQKISKKEFQRMTVEELREFLELEGKFERIDFSELKKGTEENGSK